MSSSWRGGEWDLRVNWLGDAYAEAESVGGRKEGVVRRKRVTENGFSQWAKSWGVWRFSRDSSGFGDIKSVDSD